MRRRDLLATLGVGLTGVAGCAGDDLDEEPQPTTDDDSSPTPEPTLESTPTTTTDPTTTEPTPTPVEDGPSYDFSGDSGALTDRFRLLDGLVSIELSVQGGGYFGVSLVGATTDYEELLANQIEGGTARYVRYTADGQYVLEVESDRSWNAGITQPRFTQADVQALPVSANADGPDWVGPIRFPGLARVSFEHQADGYAGVTLRTFEGEYVNLLVNDTGQVDTEAAVNNEGVGIIGVEAPGQWSLDIESA